jgi:glutathione peroxidase
MNEPVLTSRLYGFEVKTIRGELISLDIYRGQVLLIVNVASRCVFTGQYAGLQTLYEKYREQGLSVLGFPCNQFANQEPKSNNEIAAYCSVQQRITFPIFEKLDVNGSHAHPLYVYLKDQAKGWFSSEAIKWNFTKFLINRDGVVVNRYAPSTPPKRLAFDIEKCLRV